MMGDEDNTAPDDVADALMREALESVNKIERQRKDGEGGDVEIDVAAADPAGTGEAAEPAEEPASPVSKASAIRGVAAPGSGAPAPRPAAGGDDAAAELARVKDTLERVEAARKDNHDKWMRAMAELENFRKRTQKERSDLIKYGHEGLARELLGVVDNLERALAAAGNPEEMDAKAKQLVDGVKMTRLQFIQTLARFEVKPFDSMNKPFDPAIHQAMSQIPTPGVMPGTIVGEMQKGYMLHDRLLRPAMVAVSTEAGDAPEEPQMEQAVDEVSGGAADDPVSGDNGTGEGEGWV